MAYALITGASKGIGKSIAEGFGKRKYDLLIVARSEKLLADNAEELKKKFGVQVQYIAVDLSSPTAAKQIAAFCKEKNIEVNVLVNNAGYGLLGAFKDVSLDEQMNMMQLNMQSLVQLTYAMIPALQAHKGKSYILNVASTAAHQAVPYLGVYSATKAFVLSFSRSLNWEMKGTNVSVSCVCPGPTDTNFMDRAGMTNVKKIAKQAERFNMTPEAVAETAINGTLNGKLEIITGFSNKAGAFFSRHLPKKLIENTLVGLYKPGEKDVV
ncbi:MAG TPA: SDR family oxidoreductase [Bacteroidia bacterium]|jgi:short-subunit dehydrogenase|nr:SDR family oxidoreductase [Bacteroidia bacterium]